MIYCQQCGSGNVVDARFCNMCGARISQPGEPGGPLAPAEDNAPQEETLRGNPDGAAARPTPAPTRSTPPHAPTPLPQSLDVSTVSLSAIGVRSRASAWGVIVGAVLGLIALGAAGAWIAMRTSGADAGPTADAADAGTVAPPTEIAVGDPVPSGVEVPDVVPGHPEPVLPRGSAGSTRSTGSGRTSSGARPRPQSGGASSGASGAEGAAGGGSTGGSTASPSGGGSAGTPPSSGTAPSGTLPSGTEPSGTAPSGSSGSSGGGTPTAPDWGDEDVPEERDFEMEMYSTRVRSVIRQYYIQRAISCFEHASRNTEQAFGTVVVGFQIQASGEVRNATVERNTTGVESLGGCLARQVGSWRLPPPPEGSAPLAMSMPFSR